MDKRQIAGYGFLASLSATFINGLIATTKDPDPLCRQAGVARMASSSLAVVGNLILARYGSYPVATQLETLKGKLASHLQENAIPLDRATWQEAAHTHEQRNWHQKIEDFLYANPIETANAWGALTSAGLTISGYMRHTNAAASEAERSAGVGNIAQGALITSAGLASIMLPEHTRQQVQASGQEGTLWGHIQRHPLSYTNALFAAADLAQGHVAIQELGKANQLGQEDELRQWRYMMAAASAIAMTTAIGGEILVGSGSKKASGSEQALQEAREELIDEAAPILAAQPESCQHYLVAEAVDFLIRQPELRFEDADKSALRSQLEAAMKNHAYSPDTRIKEVAQREAIEYKPKQELQ